MPMSNEFWRFECHVVQFGQRFRLSIFTKKHKFKKAKQRKYYMGEQTASSFHFGIKLTTERIDM